MATTALEPRARRRQQQPPGYRLLSAQHSSTGALQLASWPSRPPAMGRRPITAGDARSLSGGVSGNSNARPQLAVHLERQLQAELARCGAVNRRPDARRVQAHREILAQLAASFHAYEPLLTSIGQEFDMYISHLERQAASLLSLQAQLATMRQAHTREMARVRLEAQLEAGKTESNTGAVRERVRHLEHENASLVEQMKQLTRVLHEEMTKLRREQAARKLMADYMSSKRRPSDPLANMGMRTISEDDDEQDVAARRTSRVGSGDHRLVAELRQRLSSADMVIEQLRLELGRAEADLALSGRSSLEAKNRSLAAERDRLREELDRLSVALEDSKGNWKRAHERAAALDIERAAHRDEAAQLTKALALARKHLNARTVTSTMDDGFGNTSEAPAMVPGSGLQPLPPVRLPALLAAAQWPCASPSTRDQHLTLEDVKLVLSDFWNDWAAEEEESSSSSSPSSSTRKKTHANAALVAAFRKYFLAQAGGNATAGANYALNVLAVCQAHHSSSIEAAIFLTALDGRVPFSARETWVSAVDRLGRALADSSSTLGEALAADELWTAVPPDAVAPWSAAGTAREALVAGDSPLQQVLWQAFVGRIGKSGKD